MSLPFLPSEAAFHTSLSSLTKTELVPELPRAAARPLHYGGSASLAFFICVVASERQKSEVFLWKRFPFIA